MLHEFPEHIAKLLKNELPGIESHRKMVPPGRELFIHESDKKLIRHGSVLLLLFPYEGKIYTCLTKRNPHMKSHPGQISLPGGKIEEGETPDLTALRETEEEVGISADKIHILGKLSELYIPVSRYSIYPYVGWIDHKPDITLNTCEAEKAIFFPIPNKQAMLKIKEIELDTVTGPLTVPYYPFDGEIIWGATAMILAEFFDILYKGEFILR